MEDESVDINDDETVTLVLGDNRIEANKKKLADYSLYFASLFSENFKDHKQNEFRINYDITLQTLRDFLHWIENEGEHTRVVHSQEYHCIVRISLEKFLSGHYSELLDLLELSVVFMAEKLTEHVIEMIVCMRFPRRNMLKIWLLAENLSLKVLRDIALATCLDRFDDIPAASLRKLPIKNFLKLVLNVNVRSDTEKLYSAIQEWKVCNDIPRDLPESFLQFLNGDEEYVKNILDDKKRRHIQCVAGNKVNKSLGIWSWNGKVLQELAEMTDAQMHTTFDDNGKELKGRQVIGRGFYIYLIGGEQGIGTGRFNNALWRYCPFSKKWYIATLLPRPRRHMAVAFIHNKLYLFGGVGRHRLKLTSVDIFDVHTGIWSKGVDIPEEFTAVPPSCVADNKFIYYGSRPFVYDPSLEKWMEYGPEGTPSPEPDSLCVIGTTEGRCANTSVVLRLDDNRQTNLKTICQDLFEWSNLPDDCERDGWILEKSTRFFDQHIIDWPHLIRFAYSGGQATVEVGVLSFTGRLSSQWETMPCDTYRRLKIYTQELPNVVPDCFKKCVGCFNMLDPDSLHNLISLPEQKSISV